MGKQRKLSKCSTRIWVQLLFLIRKTDSKIVTDDTFLSSKTVNEKHAEVKPDRVLKMIRKRYLYPNLQTS